MNMKKKARTVEEITARIAKVRAEIAERRAELVELATALDDASVDVLAVLRDLKADKIEPTSIFDR